MAANKNGLVDLGDVSVMSGQGNSWFQREISLKPFNRGCHLITQEIEKINEIRYIHVGLLHVMVKHTSASLALNDNWDPDTRVDMEMMLNKLIPDSTPFRQSRDSPDELSAHIKACLLGNTLTIPISNGKMNLSTSQGIWLCEHSSNGGSRHLVITIQGAVKDT